MRNAAGSRTIARPSATRCRWPPESCFGLRLRYSAELEDVGGRVTRLVDLLLRHRWLRRLNARLSYTVMCGYSAYDWNTIATLRAPGATLFTTRSPMRIRPLGDVLEAGEHAQRRRLAAAGRADEHEELAVGDVDVQIVDRSRVVEALRDVLER